MAQPRAAPARQHLHHAGGPEAAIAEIEKHAGNPAFVQVAITPRTIEPLGRKRYWPILEAAAAHNLPIALHADVGGKRANSGSGWFSYYWEDHVAFVFSMQTLITSLIMEGVFERVRSESGRGGGRICLGAVAGMAARQELGAHAPGSPACEAATVGIYEEALLVHDPADRGTRDPRDLLDIIRWIGADRLLFSTDYPHWDFDDPRYAFKVKLPKAEERRSSPVMRSLYGLKARIGVTLFGVFIGSSGAESN